MCDQELRKISVPYRLSRKNKSKTWKYIPNDEHWLTFSVEMLDVEAWTVSGQFSYMDTNNDSYLTENEVTSAHYTQDYARGSVERTNIKLIM